MQLTVLNVCRLEACDFPRVIPEIDTWRAATLMLKRYGEKALEQSATRDGVILRVAATTLGRCFSATTPEGKLIYAGRVGTGMPVAELERLWRRLQPLVIEKMPLNEPPPRR